MTETKILLVDYDRASGLGDGLREILQSASSADVHLRERSVGAEGRVLSRDRLTGGSNYFRPDVVFLILSPATTEQAGALLDFLEGEPEQTPIIAVVGSGSPDEMFALLKLGAADFITTPLTAVDILPRMWRVLEQARQEKTVAQALKERLGLRQLIGESQVFRTEIEKIPQLAKCDASVLIAGETGTGKELCARATHYLGPRAGYPFVPVNCGAIPLELVENELFGHERGAYTGAVTKYEGMISEADGGTLFLDEIDCLSAAAQVKLLRFLQDREYRALGSTQTRRADVRIIAAANADFHEAIQAGRLRQDLYYRLNVLSLHLPPLRERREDIVLLARHFLAKYASRFNRPARVLSPGAVSKLTRYDWPGNVRELENLIERAVALSERPIIRGNDLDLPTGDSFAATGLSASFQEAKARCVAQFERDYLQGLLRLHRGNITRAAQAAQKHRRAFWQLIRKHRIDARSFKTAGQVE